MLKDIQALALEKEALTIYIYCKGKKKKASSQKNQNFKQKGFKYLTLKNLKL